MKKIVLLGALLLFVAGNLFGQSPVIKETYLYAEKDSQPLYLDRYFVSSAEPQPCIIFMFGGAFARGTRDREDYIPYFKYMAGQGYTVVSIDYRLGLKDIAEVRDLTDEVAAGMLINAIGMAVDDLLDGTGYVLERAWDWKIDPERIITHGSSAGAVTVLQAEYEMCNGLHADRLPEGFRYAGVMAFAGAVLTLDGTFDYAGRPAPTLLMQGDADRQVPFNVLRLGDLGFYGSKWISDYYLAHGYPHYFYNFENYGHEIASLPIKVDGYWSEVDMFLENLVKRRHPDSLIFMIEDEEMPVVENKDFTIGDFLNGNYGL